MINKGAAGFLIGKKEESGNWLFLALFAPIEKRINRDGIYDIPKGARKPGETFLECAKRECFEETGIIPDRIIAGPFVDGPLAIWIGQTDEELVIISENPETGEREHEGYEWLKPKDIKNKSLDFLKPSIDWAEKTVWEYFKL